MSPHRTRCPPDHSASAARLNRVIVPPTTESDVLVSGNRVTRFHNSAIVVERPSRPADVYGNTAFSEDSTAKVVALKGKAGQVANNRLAPPGEDAR